MRSASPFAVFVGECGWPVEEFKAWSYRMRCDQLLSPNPPLIKVTHPPEA